MNSRAPISGFDRPSRASCAMWTSWEVSSPVVSTVRLRTISPVASRSRLARSPNACTPIRVQHVASGGQLLPRGSTHRNRLDRYPEFRCPTGRGRRHLPRLAAAPQGNSQTRLEPEATSVSYGCDVDLPVG